MIQKVEETIHVCENSEALKHFSISNDQVANAYCKLWKAKKTNRLPLLLLTSFRMLIVCFFIMTVVHHFLTENTKVILLLVIISIVLLSQSKWLLSQYMKMENQFLNNLKGSRKKDEENTNDDSTSYLHS